MSRLPQCRAHLTYLPPYCHPLSTHHSQCWLSSSPWIMNVSPGRPSSRHRRTYKADYLMIGTAAVFWLTTGRLPHVTASPICIQSAFCYHIASSGAGRVWSQFCSYGIRGGKYGTSNMFFFECFCLPTSSTLYNTTNGQRRKQKASVQHPPSPPPPNSTQITEPQKANFYFQTAKFWHKPNFKSIPRAQTF
jgi:hypothetical protein